MEHIREQWRALASRDDDPGFIGYRGLMLRRSDVEGALGQAIEGADHRAVADAIIKVLGANVGQHWSTVPGVATAFALPTFIDTVSVLLVAAIPDQSVDRHPSSSAGVYQGSDEFERYLKVGARVELAKVCYLTSGAQWIEVVVTHLPPVKAMLVTAQRDGDERPFGSYTMRYRTSDQGERKPRHIIETFDGSTKVGELDWYGTTGTILSPDEFTLTDHLRQVVNELRHDVRSGEDL